MKRLISIILIAFLFLSGCSMTGEWIKEPVTFYYIREDYQKEMDQVIESEVREASGHREDLSYLLTLYSMGPTNEDLISLLPSNTIILPTERTDTSIELTLSDNVSTVSDLDFTLSSTCIALTCMELIDIRQVTIICGERTITINKDNLLLQSSFGQIPQEEIQ